MPRHYSDPMVDSRSERAQRTAGEALSLLVDAGNTPLWFAPPTLQNESSMRSTLEQAAVPPKQEHGHPRHLPFGSPRGGAAHESEPECPLSETVAALPAYIYASFTPINRAHPAVRQTTSFDRDKAQPKIPPTDSETFGQHYGRSIPDVAIDMYEVSEHELDSLDHDEGRVYHVGINTGGSYSGRFPERPLKPELEIMIRKTISEHAKKESKALQYEAGAETEESIRVMLSAGLKLVLWQTSMFTAATGGPKCRLPGCLALTETMGPATFYLTLQSWKAQDLSCGSARHRPISISQLDGAPDLALIDATISSKNVTESMYASRWAPRDSDDDEEEASPTTTTRPSTPEPEHSSTEDDMLPESSGSTDSRGMWLHPPRRVQYIAAFIEPSATLTQEVRAAVWLWKAASKAQLDWDRHMKVCYNDESMQNQQQAKEVKIEIDDFGEEEIRQYEGIVGFSKKACYGNVLSEMLRRVEKH